MPRERSPRTRRRAASSSAKGEDEKPETSERKTQTMEVEGSDPTLNFFYQPHTITALIAMLGVFLYVAIFTSEYHDLVVNSKNGIAAGAIVFLLLGLLMFQDGPFIRPHPALWRVVLASSALYQILLVFILFQNAKDVRKMLSFVDSSLGVQLPEKSYAENCELSYDNVMEQMDEFVIAHALGWVAKAIILRDHWILWILSVMFEVLEYSLQHQLPNFAECWWDHWILDVLVCNWLGLWLGMKFCRYMELKEYSWRGIRQITSVRGKVKRAVQQFTPYSWTRFDWAYTKDFSHFLTSLLIIIVFLIGELNAFYLKYLLWIPPTNPINTYRLMFFFLSGCAAIREVHQYVNDDSCKRLGAHAWLAIANIVTETLVCIKFGKNEFQEPAPWFVKVFWAVFTLILTCYAVYQFVIYPRLQKKSV